MDKFAAAEFWRLFLFWNILWIFMILRWSSACILRFVKCICPESARHQFSMLRCPVATLSTHIETPFFISYGYYVNQGGIIERKIRLDTAWKWCWSVRQLFSTFAMPKWMENKGSFNFVNGMHGRAAWGRCAWWRHDAKNQSKSHTWDNEPSFYLYHGDDDRAVTNSSQLGVDFGNTIVTRGLSSLLHGCLRRR